MKTFFTLILFFSLGCGKSPKKSSTEKQNPNPLFSTDTITIKVFYEPGAEPYVSDDQVAIIQYWLLLEKNLDALFLGRKNPPKIIVPKTLGEMTAMPEAKEESWTPEEVLTLAKKMNTSSSPTTFNIYFLNGKSTENERVLGFHISQTTTIAIFKDVIKATASGELADYVPKYVEQATLIHEMGHALGLVKNGVPMKGEHHDDEHPAHCSNPKCVMYYQNEGASGLMSFVKTMIETQSNVMYDEQCLTDTRTY